MPESARDPYPFWEIVDTGESVKFDMDGEKWCANRASFINLQESIAGFGDTPMQALANLIFNEGVEVMGASSRVAALEQRIAEAIAILDQAGDNRDEALARLREVKG